MTIFIHVFRFTIYLFNSMLFFYLITHMCTPNQDSCTRLRITLCIILKTLAYYVPYNLPLVILLDLGMALYFTRGPLIKRIAWGCSYLIATFLISYLFYQLSFLYTQYSIHGIRRYDESAREQRILLNTFGYTAFVFICTHFNREDFSLPKPLLIPLGMLVLMGVTIYHRLMTLSCYFAVLSRTFRFMNYILIAILFGLLGIIQCLGMIYKKNTDLREENQRKNIEEQQFRLFASTTQLLREWKHDYQNQLLVLDNLIEQKDYGKAGYYIKQLEQSLSGHSWGVSSGNSVIDAVISTKLMTIRELGISFQHTIYLPSRLPLDDLALSSLMGNLMDNAIDACRRIAASEAPARTPPRIQLQIKPRRGMLYISLENSSDGSYDYDSSGALISFKKSVDHGIGLRRIRQIVEEAQGFLQLQPENEYFSVTIMLPLENRVNEAVQKSDTVGDSLS